MNIQPTLDVHPHQEFHFAEDTDSTGCCCWWSSKSKPKSYYIEPNGVLVSATSTTNRVNDRIVANRRLARLVASKFEHDPCDNNEAFERLRKRINYNFEGSDRITEEKLITIVNAMYEVKTEVRREASISEKLTYPGRLESTPPSTDEKKSLLEKKTNSC